MISSIASSLGFGSGIDLPKLVSDLAAASRDPKVARFDARARAVQASISAVALARADLDGFSTSLAALVVDGSLQSQPVVSDASVLDATPRTGTRLGKFSGTIEVLQLARGQTSASAYAAAKTDPIGQGTLTITTGGTATNITIGPANDSLDGLAAAINGANSGVTATIITDTQGARIVMKGASGAAAAFAVTSSDPVLAGYTSAGGLAPVQTAQDARFRVDGLDYARSSNVVDDVVPGLSLTLKKVAVDVPVTISVTRSADTLKSTLDDFVSVYNTLKSHITDARTATRNDAALRLLDQQLSRLLTQAVSSTAPASLSAVGVRTNRDGTIALDEPAFRAAYAENPEGVEALFIPTRSGTQTAATDPGIGGALEALRTTAGGQISGLSSRLGKESQAIAKDRGAMEDRETVYRTRLERQFAGLDGRVGALKATQSYLDQQIKIWTKSN